MYRNLPFWTQVNGRVPFCVYYDSKEVSISVQYVSATMAIDNLFIHGLGATPISCVHVTAVVLATQQICRKSPLYPMRKMQIIVTQLP